MTVRGLAQLQCKEVVERVSDYLGDELAPDDRAWPPTWIEAEGPLAPCVRGIHVCRPEDLEHWIHEELWEVEVDGEQTNGLDCLVVRRARLARRIDAWSDRGAERFAEASIAHA